MFRTPDIGARKNVRFRRRSGDGSGISLYRRAREGEPDTGWWTHCEAHAQARAREDHRGLIEDLAQSLGGACTMRRAERGQGDTQLGIGDLDVACSGEQLMQESSSLLLDTGIMRSQQRNQIALDLISYHLDDVGQMLAFGGVLDHGLLA